MALEWIKDFIGGLERLVEKPPYLIFVFTGAVFVIIALIFNRNFEQVWTFFLYSVGGAIWRYIERDLIHTYGQWRQWFVFLYHLGNVGLFIVLINYLNFI